MKFETHLIQVTFSVEELTSIARDLARLGFDDRTQKSDDFIKAVESICKIEIPRQLY